MMLFVLLKHGFVKTLIPGIYSTIVILFTERTVVPHQIPVDMEVVFSWLSKNALLPVNWTYLDWLEVRSDDQNKTQVNPRKFGRSEEPSFACNPPNWT
ncbi:hypothetical protein AVEN_189388-1 [Araneus ventricosus]|uniref:Uncharacterized protein n=1 Tax=Araneus ventricosus TaxID=182803 RepID=A0A4Y2S5M5_ARAVE|nr:hypothetical protein AVEN_71528-1 [Araneus ventricosus]GBN83193.1 hypothetical protein AVEN_189388-1 [Araneus ventricosus]